MHAQGSLWEVTLKVLVRGLEEQRRARKTVWSELTEGSRASAVPTGHSGLWALSRASVGSATRAWRLCPPSSSYQH